MFPIRDSTRSSRGPLLTWLLIAATTVRFPLFLELPATPYLGL